MAKLAILLDSRSVAGLYPSKQELRDSYGRSLAKLFAKIESIIQKSPIGWCVADVSDGHLAVSHDL